MAQIIPQIQETNVKSIELVRRSFVEVFLDFCNHTNLHGFRQLVNSFDHIDNLKFRRNLQKIKSFIWSVAILINASFGAYLFYIVYTRYESTPTITSVETNNYGIWNVRFPAVTICNSNVVYKPNTENITKQLLDLNVSQTNIENFLKSFSSFITLDEVHPKMIEISKLVPTINYKTFGLFLLDLAQPCSKLLKSCKWLGYVFDCNSIFRTIKSEYGICCSFNYKALKDSFEILRTFGDNDAQITSPPIRMSGSGDDIGLKVAIDVEPKHYVSPVGVFYGAHVLVHDSEDFPDASSLVAISQPGYELSIAVNPSIVETTESIKNFPEKLRFCRFDSERKMNIVKKYSYNACIVECRIETMLNLCNCLAFYYTTKVYDNITEAERAVRTKNKTDINYCSFADLKCLNENKRILASLQPDFKIYTILNVTKVGMDCDCLPSCLQQSYRYETFSTKRFENIKKNNSINNTHDVGVVKVFYKDLACIKYRRDIFMTWDDVLASFGGIFGLCLGGSVLTVIEMFYYLTIQLFTKIVINRYKENYLKQHQNSVLSKLYTNDFMKLNNNKTLINHKKMVW